MEPPGTAPGSDPRITGAFIAIVRVAPNRVNIGAGRSRRKHACPDGLQFVSGGQDEAGGIVRNRGESAGPPARQQKAPSRRARRGQCLLW